MLARCCGSMQKTSRNMMRPVAASSCAACICLQHCAYGKVEPLATFCMCASCESSRQHHCQHAIISSPQESRLRPRKRLLLSSGLGTPRGEANGRRLYSGSEGALPRAKQEEHACRPNRRSHRSITRLLAHSRLHRPSRQLRHASGRRLAGVGESPRQGLAGGSEQHGRFAAIANVFSGGGPGVSGRVAGPVEDFIERRYFCHRCACSRGVQAE